MGERLAAMFHCAQGCEAYNFPCGGGDGGWRRVHEPYLASAEGRGVGREVVLDCGNHRSCNVTLPELVLTSSSSPVAAASEAASVAIADPIYCEAPKSFLVVVLPGEFPTALQEMPKVADVRWGGGRI